MANRNLECEALSYDQLFKLALSCQKYSDLPRETFKWRPTSRDKKISELMKVSNKPQGPSDGDKTKNTGNDESVGCRMKDTLIQLSKGVLKHTLLFGERPPTMSEKDVSCDQINDESVGCMSIAGALTIKNSNGVSLGNTTLDLSGISEAVLGIGKQILKVVEDGMNQFLTLISKLVSSSLENRRLKRCINKIK